MVLKDQNVSETGDVESLDADVAPNAAGHQHWTPVPAEIARFLAHPSPALGLMLPGPFIKHPLGLAFLDLGKRGVEGDLDGVLALFQGRLGIKLPKAEHVVRPAHFLAVDPNNGERIQPLAT